MTYHLYGFARIIVALAALWLLHLLAVQLG